MISAEHPNGNPVRPASGAPPCAQVAVEKALPSFDRLFDYLVPAGMQLQPGCRVLVPFGSGPPRVGMVFSLNPPEREKGLKPILRQLDARPSLSEKQLALATFLQDHTFCTWFDAVRQLLPLGGALQVSLRYLPLRKERPVGLEPELIPLFSHLCRTKAGVTPAGAAKALKLEEDVAASQLETLCAQGLVRKETVARRRLGEETALTVELCPDRPEDLSLTEKQRQVLILLEEVGQATLKELMYYCGCTRSVPEALAKKGVLRFFEKALPPQIRQSLDGSQESLSSLALTPAQQQALEGLWRLYCDPAPRSALLYGVTGSGKTVVFLKLIGRVLEQGKGAVLLIPEISLSPQTAALFRRYFGPRVAVLHSSLSLGERLTEYERCQKGEARVVVGTRSAVFAPVQKLGLMILDEEQEGSYKSERSPIYHAREVARFRCGQEKALLLLASATPSVESYTAATEGKTALFSLSGRYQGAALPQVEVLDMRGQLREGNLTVFHPVLARELEENLSRGQQSILLLNRRGYHTALTCVDCGQPIVCPHCSIPMTYHRANGRMMCHYCGYSSIPPAQCPGCGSQRIKAAGVGTQQAQEQLQALLPQARILRMDADTTLSRYAYEEQFGAFARGEYDLLLGTQMVAKGLNFPNATLVGVLSADQALYSEDFRSYEKAFSLLTQVVGRCGRGDKPGRAFIQTVSPEHPVIALAAQQNYPAFYAQEILNRRMMLYPPYCTFCMALFSSLRYERALTAAKRFAQLLAQEITSCNPPPPVRVLGPAEGQQLKLNNKYRVKLLVKCRNNRAFRDLLRRTAARYYKDPAVKEVSLTLDLSFDGVF